MSAITETNRDPSGIAEGKLTPLAASVLRQAQLKVHQRSRNPGRNARLASMRKVACNRHLADCHILPRRDVHGRIAWNLRCPTLPRTTNQPSSGYMYSYGRSTKPRAPAQWCWRGSHVGLRHDAVDEPVVHRLRVDQALLVDVTKDLCTPKSNHQSAKGKRTRGSQHTQVIRLSKRLAHFGSGRLRPSPVTRTHTGYAPGRCCS
eukprot:COSAG04_NODE_4304_length_2170_cov_1.845002_1_plen_203_part_10